MNTSPWVSSGRGLAAPGSSATSQALTDSDPRSATHTLRCN
jgi:hypothetical protein